MFVDSQENMKREEIGKRADLRKEEKQEGAKKMFCSSIFSRRDSSIEIVSLRLFFFVFGKEKFDRRSSSNLSKQFREKNQRILCSTFDEGQSQKSTLRVLNKKPLHRGSENSFLQFKFSLLEF